MPYKYSLFIAFVILLLPAITVSAEADAAELMDQGITRYDKGDFDAARTLFAQAVELQPDNSEYHNWLGKSYGRIAEHANWIKAMLYAKKTLKEFQIAVELDQDNQHALGNLMQYYQQAPGFLGGSSKKAAVIAGRLAKIQTQLEHKSADTMPDK